MQVPIKDRVRRTAPKMLVRQAQIRDKVDRPRRVRQGSPQLDVSTPLIERRATQICGVSLGTINSTPVSPFVQNYRRTAELQSRRTQPLLIFI